MKTLNLAGSAFGRLTVIERAGSRNGKSLWRCECSCGKTVAVAGGQLTTLKTQSCGCRRSDLARSRAKMRNTRHGHNRTDVKSGTWRSWRAMNQRCRQQSHVSFNDYGGRGVHVCDRWRDFKNFLFDMGERPEGHTLDRIDVDGSYEPENCRWATRSEQQRNKRCHKIGAAP